MAEYTSTGTQAGATHGNGSPNGGVTGMASQAASGLVAQVKSKASSQFAVQQSKAAEGIGSVASALRKAGHELRTHNEGLASYADMAVDELEHISTRIREKPPGEYVADLEQFARSRPAAFVGGAFLLGVGLARFLKSTQPRRPQQAYSPYDAGYRGAQDPWRDPSEQYRGYASEGPGYSAEGHTGVETSDPMRSAGLSAGMSEPTGWADLSDDISSAGSGVQPRSGRRQGAAGSTGETGSTSGRTGGTGGAS
jgi:hypothetical protein